MIQAALKFEIDYAPPPHNWNIV